MTVSDYLDAVCAGIKYRSIHREVREELSTHIHETAEELGCPLDEAVKYMGSPEETGAMFNEAHRMPFNSSRGLFLWAALYALFICIAYILINVLNGYRIFSLMPLIIVFVFANGKLLKRGRFKMSAADAADIIMGAAAGLAVGMVLIFTPYLSDIWNTYVADYNNTFDFSGGTVLAISGVAELSALIIYFYSCANSAPKGEAPYYVFFFPMKYDVEKAFGSDDKKSTDK